MFSCVTNGRNLPFNAAFAKAAGDENPVRILQNRGGVRIRNILGGYPHEIYGGIVYGSSVFERFHDADISVMQLGIFSDQCNLDML